MATMAIALIATPAIEPSGWMWRASPASDESNTKTQSSRSSTAEIDVVRASRLSMS